MSPSNALYPRVNSDLFSDFLRILISADNPNELWPLVRVFIREHYQASISIHLLDKVPGDWPKMGYSARREVWHLATESNPLDIFREETEGKSYVLGLSLSLRGKLWGSLVFRRKDKDFDPVQCTELENIGLLLMTALQSFLYIEAQKLQKKRLKLIASVSEQLAHISDLKQLTRQVCRLIRSTFGYYYVALFTVDPDEGELRFMGSDSASTQGVPLYETQANQQMKLGFHLVGRVGQSGKAIVANDVRQEPDYLAQASLPETEAEMVLPLKLGDQTIGVLDVQSNQLNAFDEQEKQILGALANSIAISIHRVRLHAQESKRSDLLNLIAEAGRSINSELDMDKLLLRVTDLMHREFNYPYVHIYLMKYAPMRLEFSAGSGVRSTIYQREGLSFDFNAEVGIIPATARNDRVHLVQDVSSEPLYVPNPITHSMHGSELALPLRYGGSILGVLDVQSDEVNAFNEEDLELISTLSSHISIAIRNANHYNTAQWRARVAENLREVATLLSKNIPLESFYQDVMARIQDILPNDFTSIWLLEDALGDVEQTLDPTPNTDGLPSNVLRMVSFRARDGRSLPVGDVPSSADYWFGHVLRHESPVIRDDHDICDPFRSLFDLPEGYSAIAAPLIIGGQAVGALVLHIASHGRYGLETPRISASFAAYLGAAIEQERLARASQEQAWLNAILLQVAQATQSLSRVQDLVETIGQILLALIGGQAGALLLRDEDCPTFSLVAAFGDLPDGVQSRLPISVSDSQAFFEVIEINKPISVVAREASPLLCEAFDLNPEDQLMLFPLLAHEKSLGILLHITPKGEAEAGHVNLEANKLAIAEGIAQQTAVTLQNIQLTEDRQTASYLANMQLELTRVLSSAPSLVEGLQRVCAAVPLISGVEDVAILELDRPKKRVLMQHYSCLGQCLPGMARGMTAPISDALHLERFADGLSFMAESGHWLADLFAVTPPARAVEHEDDYSTLIFPLAVSGEVYGLLCARNCDKVQREQRIDLISGLSAQISASIQNEQLHLVQQQQIVVEKEFHLAREIQKTFLPDHLPELPGFDLAVEWQTARQVGGDFYDVFELEPGLTALVIADVSDKGLAASLYMTVSRTLVRSAALEMESPAKTLERVNRLLQLDSTSSFFVTLIYAVLDRERGLLTYCNAGHNPPFYLNYEKREVRRLDKGCVVLGMMPDISLRDEQLQLNPGDGLVFYTDGVTECINDENDLFGEKRFASVLSQHFSGSSAEIVKDIMASLEEYRDGAPVSDDSTLLALRRNL